MYIITAISEINVNKSCCSLDAVIEKSVLVGKIVLVAVVTLAVLAAGVTAFYFALPLFYMSFHVLIIAGAASVIAAFTVGMGAIFVPLIAFESSMFNLS